MRRKSSSIAAAASGTQIGAVRALDAIRALVLRRAIAAVHAELDRIDDQVLEFAGVDRRVCAEVLQKNSGQPQFPRFRSPWRAMRGLAPAALWRHLLWPASGGTARRLRPPCRKREGVWGTPPPSGRGRQPARAATVSEEVER
jgi:hypothetical protein